MGVIFIKMVHVDGKYRAKCLPGQFDGDGEPIDPNVSVSCDKTNRAEHPIGTIFATDAIVMLAAAIYHAAPKTLRVVAKPDNEKMLGALDSDYAQYLSYLEKNNADETLSKTTKRPREIKVKTLMDKLRDDPNMQPPTIEADGFYVSDEVWWTIVRNITKRKNTMLTGPTGTGKTELLLLAGKKLGKTVHVHDMGTMQDPAVALLGTHRFVRGESKFDYAKFTRDITEPALIVKDEISRAPLAATNILFSTLDSRRYLDVAIADSEHARIIPLHEDCVMFATANIGSEYVGTHTLDAALMNRYFIIDLDYLPQETEALVLVKRTGCDPKHAEIISNVATQIRRMAKTEEIAYAVSHRHTLEVAELTKDGFALLQAFRSVFLPQYRDNAEDKEKILSLIQRY